MERSTAKTFMDTLRLGLRRTFGLRMNWVFYKDLCKLFPGHQILGGLLIRHRRAIQPYAEAMLGLCKAASAQEPVKPSVLTPLPEPKGLFAYLEIREAFQLATQQLEVEQVMRRHVWRSA